MPRKLQSDDYTVFSLSIPRAQRDALKASAALLGMSMATICTRLLEKWLDGDVKLTNLPANPLAKKK
jgi:hypothetical protein